MRLLLNKHRKLQWRRVVAQWERLSAIPVGGKGMPPFPLGLPQTLALGSRPCPGPGGARCAGAQRLPEIQILGRLVLQFSHARQACQVCQCPQSLRWPSTTSCIRCREMPMRAWFQSSQYGGQSCSTPSGDLKDLDNLGINLETLLAAITLSPFPVDTVRHCS